VVAKPLIYLSYRFYQSHIQHLRLIRSRIFLTFAAFVAIIILSSCNTTTTVPLSSKTPNLTDTSISIPTSTSILVPAITPTPSLTLEPYGTPIIVQAITEAGNLFQPIGVPVTFESAFEDLPPSFYMILRIVNAENGIEELLFTSLDSGMQEELLLVNEILNLEFFYYDFDRSWIVGGYPGTSLRYLFDLRSQSALQFTICHERHPAELSPSGYRLALICTDNEMIQDRKLEV
jgi:hypothetical protein